MNTSKCAPAWVAAARDLARWGWGRLVNRTDVWGGYVAPAERDRVVTGRGGTARKLGPSITRPARANRGKVLLTPAVLDRHFRALAAEHVIGLHTTSAANTSLWGAIDIDHHGEGGPSPERNHAAALAWYQKLLGLGFRPLLTDSNGTGGYHLRTLFRCPVPTAKVYQFLLWLSRDHAALGLPNRPETFPKQPHLAPGRYGNWLRVPGRHHSREHWSRVWDGERWLAGAAAAGFILQLTGDLPDLIPAGAAAPPGRHRQPAFMPGPRSGGNAGIDGRIRAYLSRLPQGLCEGQHRDDFAYRFGAWLSRDMALPLPEALAWLLKWDALQAAPKGEARLLEILKNACNYGQRPIGCGRTWRGRSRAKHRPVILVSRVETR
jgi:hypothetical protein